MSIVKGVCLLNTAGFQPPNEREIDRERDGETADAALSPVVVQTVYMLGCLLCMYISLVLLLKCVFVFLGF